MLDQQFVWEDTSEPLDHYDICGYPGKLIIY